MKVLISICLLLSFMYAGSSPKGLRVFKQTCLNCHGSGGYAAKQLNKSKWIDYFYFNAIKLKKVHNSEPKVAKSIKSLSKKKLSNLKAFLLAQAKDSGYVDGCNADTCGLRKGKVKISK